MKIPKLCAALVLTSLAGWNPALHAVPAQDPFSGAEWALLDRDKTIAAAKEMGVAQLPDSDEATVDERSVRLIHLDGTAEDQDETYTKLLTEKGRESATTMSNYFLLPYWTVEVTRLEVIKPDGRSVPVDVAANSKESIDDSGMQANIYDPNSKVLKVNIPKLEVGDIVHSVVRSTWHVPFMPGEYAENQLFEDTGYILHGSFEVRIPASKPLKQIELRHEVPGTVVASVRTEGDTLIYDWDASRVARIYPEPAMPPFEEVIQRLSVSTTPDWQTVSTWYWNLSKPHLDAVTPEMKQQVGALTAGAATDQDRIRSLFNFVSKDIRYMGLTFEKGRPGFEPHDVCVTFDKKYGVCRDKAALLVSMLRTAGFNAFPVLVNVGLKKDQQVPNPFFNHAIVGVDLGKEAYMLMDPTAENTRDLLPDWDCDQSYLVCRPEGDVLRRSPVPPPELNMMRIATEGTLDSKGRLVAHSRLGFDGINDSAYRQAFAEMKPDARKRFFEAGLKRVLPGAVVDSIRVTPDNLSDTSVPLGVELGFSVGSTTAFGEGKAIVNVPWVGNDTGMWSFLLRNAGLEKRVYPMQTYYACGLHEDVALHLDSVFTGSISMPTCAPRSDDSLSYQRTYAYRDGVLTCSREVKLKTVEYSPAQYLVLKQTLKELADDDRKAPLLAATAPPEELQGGESIVGSAAPVEPDALVVEKSEKLRAVDAHTATITLRVVEQILTYNGKKREAELKYPYNPATEAVRLVRAVVTSKDGKRQEVAENEINIMDAAWDGTAKRYTAGKILVANLPGVDIGSTIEYEVEIKIHDKPYVSAFTPFQLGDRLQHGALEITAPPGMMRELTCGPAGLVKEATRVENGLEVRSWAADNLDGLPVENNVPPSWEYRSGVAFFAGDFQAYLGDLRAALVARSGNSAKAGDLARTLAPASLPRLDALAKIRDYVDRSVRLDGPTYAELPLSELSDADVTLAQGYGHVADRAILLHAMLEASGFKPQFVLGAPFPAIEPLSSIARKVPLPAEFENVLVRVDVGGEPYYLNDTDQYSRLGSTPHENNLGIALDDRSYLTVHPAGRDETGTTMRYAMKLTDAGTLRLKVTREFYGTAFGTRNKFFAELRPEERRRYYQTEVSQVAQGARPVGDLTTSFTGYPGIEEFTVEVENYAVVDGRYMYFDLPYVLHPYPAFTDRHVLPMLIWKGRLDRSEAAFELPPGFSRVVIAPRNRDYVAPSRMGGVRVTASLSGATWTVTQVVKSDPAIIDPKDYPSFLGLESAIENKSSRLLLLERELPSQAGGRTTAQP